MKKGQSHTFEKGQSGAAIGVRVIPTSGKSKVGGILPDGQVKINLNLGGKEENAQLISFLALLFQLPEKNFEIVAGADKRDKLIAIVGIDPGRLQEKLR